MKHEAQVTQDMPGKKIIITRNFDAPPEKVWRAFTQREILDQWWAPKPFKMETRTLDLKPGGIWHFCMIGENDVRHFWRVNYLTIDPQRSITSASGPADENANFTAGTPFMQRLTEFAVSPAGTMVSITINFENEADIQKMVEGGMIAGTTAVFYNLDELLKTAL